SDFDPPLTFIFSPRLEGRGEGEGSASPCRENRVSPTVGSAVTTAKCFSASAVVISKNVGCGFQSATSFRIFVKPAATSLFEIISPFTRIRSRKVTRCGEVKRPVRYFWARQIESIIAQTDPLPLVPAT